MNYAELVQSVADITDRGENPAAIQLAIAKATLKFHLADFWNRDVVEVEIVPDVVEGMRMEVFISSQLPGHRKVSYVNGYDDVTDPLNPRVMANFTETSPAQIRDVYGYKKLDVFYRAGDVLTFWTHCIPPKLLVGHWVVPNVQASNYQSWIADIAPFAILDEACAEIFGSVGDDDEAARRIKMFPSNLQLVRMQDVEAMGR